MLKNIRHHAERLLARVMLYMHFFQYCKVDPLLLQVIDSVFRPAFDHDLVVGLGREYEVGHSHATFCVERLDAAAVDEHSELSHLDRKSVV